MRENSATLPALPVPAGAEPDIWTDDGYRDIYLCVGTVLASSDIMLCPLVTATARQDASGRLDRFAVEVDVLASELLSADQARELAALIVQAAAAVDEWAGR